MSDLIRRFLERTDDFGGAPVFHEVGALIVGGYRQTFMK